jgi:hypothetical protein
VANDKPTAWPKRPKGFYTDSGTFCREVLSARLKDASADSMSVLLLAGGAALGGAGLAALIKANAEVIDSRGRDWGIDKLSTYVGVGSALVGTAVGLGLLTRTLARKAPGEAVERERTRLIDGKHEFERLAGERDRGTLSAEHHRLAVERLFWVLTTQ